MNPISSLVFLLLLTVFPTQILCQSLIDQACGYTSYKSLCLSTLQSDNEAKSAKDLLTIAKVALKYTGAKAQEVNAEVKKLQGSAKDEGLKQALTDCAENYGDAIDQIKSSTTALGSKKYNDVKTWVSAAMNDADSCEQGFQDQSVNSPIASLSTTFTQLSSNVLAITNHL
ncbi:pectinesterase inhibitor-like [Castanea sativa]|uniref:pectinesterase inhibitor-like n=1 Tax=Castanea sativa TaxID=21020 RepID=UPI003F6505CD